MEETIQCMVVGCQRVAAVRCEQCKRYYCAAHSCIICLPRREGEARKRVRAYCPCCKESLERAARGMEREVAEVWSRQK
jgi:hypothetical protein